MLLPVRVAGKSHAGWSLPALHAAPTNPPQRRQLSCCELQGREGNWWVTDILQKGESFKGRKLLFDYFLEERTEPRAGHSFSDYSIQHPRQKASLGLLLYVDLACSSFTFCCSLCFSNTDMGQHKCGTTSYTTSLLTQRRCTMSRRTSSTWESSCQGSEAQAPTRGRSSSSWRRCCNPC